MTGASLETEFADATLAPAPGGEFLGRENRSRPSVTVAGPGRLGQAIGRLLHEAGFSIRFVAARRIAAARRAARFIGSGSAVLLSDSSLAGSDVVLLTVTDAALTPLASEWAGWRSAWRGKVVLHTSGALPSTVLGPLKQLGASIGSLHPFQTVPSAAVGYRNLPNAFWAIEGDDRARRMAAEIAHALDGLPFNLKPARKTLYHAGAMMSCGAVVALLDYSVQMLRSAGVPPKIIRPMLGQFVSETVRNFVALGGHGALTGPAARGDWSTIEEHARAIRRHAPGALTLYRDLVRSMAKLAGRKLPRGLKV